MSFERQIKEENMHVRNPQCKAYGSLKSRERESEKDRESVRVRGRERLVDMKKKPQEKNSVARASIILVLPRWGETSDLTSTCAASLLGWAGLDWDRTGLAAQGWAEKRSVHRI